MGVALLWKELEAAHSVTTWNQLSDQKFRSTPGVRGFRVGIDFGLWLFHVKGMKHDGVSEEHRGVNADLRTIFTRLVKLLHHGILAVAVLDGPHRPPWKRNKFVSGGTTQLERDSIEVFEMLGVEWRRAPGEAEAELAEMSVRGEIDAVLSDDVDTFLFGATMVIRNPSKQLSGNMSEVARRRRAALPDANSSPLKPTSSFHSASPPASDHSSEVQYPEVPAAYEDALVTWSEADIRQTTGFTRDDLILIALMHGGDYSAGLEGCGIVYAKRLAEAGYGKKLLRGIRALEDDQAAQKGFVREWKDEVATVLRDNPDKLFDKKKPSLAKTLVETDAWPNLDVVRFYAHPRVSNPDERTPLTWSRGVDLARLVPYPSRAFEWSNDHTVAYFARHLWIGLAKRQIRHAAVERDQIALGDPVTVLASSTPSVVPSTWVESVLGYKCEPSTAFTPSYRLELDRTSFDSITERHLPNPDPHPFPRTDHLTPEELELFKEVRRANGKPQNPPGPLGTSDFRHWVPVAFVANDASCRKAVKAWEDKANEARRREEDKAEKKRERDRIRAEKAAKGLGSPRSKATREKGKGKAKVKGGHAPRSSGDEVDDDKEARLARAETAAEKQARLRAELLALAKNGGTKATCIGRQGPSRSRSATTAVVLDSPGSSDLELAEASTSRLRSTTASGRNRSPPVAANLFPSFATSKPSGARKAPAEASSSTTSFFASSKSFLPATTKVPKRAITPIAIDLSDDSDLNDEPTAPRHIDKSPRRTRTHTSPSKRRDAPTEILELSSSSSSSDEEAGLIGHGPRQGSLAESALSRSEGGNELATAFWQRRKGPQGRGAALIQSIESNMSSRVGARGIDRAPSWSTTGGGGGRPQRASRSPTLSAQPTVETLVLSSDSD
ncbi:hypothetical protein JCM10212_002955 [Sporobolomyces blumeae]